MIGAKQIELMRLKTRMTEAHEATKSMYPSMRDGARKHLAQLQEQYKSMTGEYANIPGADIDVSEEHLNEIQAGSELVRRKAAEALLGKVAGMLQEHQHEEKKILKGYTLVANLGEEWNEILNEITRFLNNK